MDATEGLRRFQRAAGDAAGSSSPVPTSVRDRSECDTSSATQVSLRGYRANECRAQELAEIPDPSSEGVSIEPRTTQHTASGRSLTRTSIRENGMTDKTVFTEAEWHALTDAPLLVTLAMIVTGEHGPISMVKEVSASAHTIAPSRRPRLR